MILAIDAGNSTVSFGFFDGERLAHVFKAETRRGATPDEYRAFIASRMDGAGIEAGVVEGIVIASVVPTLVHVFFEAMKGLCEATPLLVSSRLKLPIKIKYATPETLGADRIASASAAYAAYGGPVVVVDFGTATTLSAVDGGGAFVGGSIAPGLLTGYEALTERATGLPRVGLTYPKSAVGASTAEGLQAGIIFGHAAMVDGLLDRSRAELGKEARAVATGGMADMVLPHLTGLWDADPHLTLKGLQAIYRLNPRA